MCDLGMNPDSFNPRIMYMVKRKFNGESKSTYHSHDFSSMVFILAGSCTYNINSGLYSVKKGDLIVCNPGVFHCKLLSPADEVVEFHVGLNNISLEGLPKNHLIPDSLCPIINLSKYEQDYFKCCSEILLEQEK